MTEHRSATPLRNLPHVRRYILAAAVIAIVLAAWGIVSRIEALASLRTRTEQTAIPTVATIRATRGPTTQDLVLPGTLQAYADSPIYARTNGYLKRWLVDIGTTVKTGQLLAEIDAPEVDQELRQAEAELATARANSKVADSTATRWRDLLKRNFVSRQAADEKIADAEAKRAVEDSARANAARLRELESFKRIVAPFDGLITARNTDVGTLVQAGSGSTARELFHIADTRELIAYLQIPQTYAQSIGTDTEVTLQLVERPEKVYAARVLRTAQAIDEGSRTLLTELVAEAGQTGLLPGAYIEAHLKIQTRADSLRLPANALLFRQDGLLVATVGDNRRVTFKPVTLGRDFGREVEILSGIDTEDRVILNPPDSITAGILVQVAATPTNEPEHVP